MARIRAHRCRRPSATRRPTAAQPLESRLSCGRSDGGSQSGRARPALVGGKPMRTVRRRHVIVAPGLHSIGAGGCIAGSTGAGCGTGGGSGRAGRLWTERRRRSEAARRRRDAGGRRRQHRQLQRRPAPPGRAAPATRHGRAPTAARSRRPPPRPRGRRARACRRRQSAPGLRPRRSRTRRDHADQPETRRRPGAADAAQRRRRSTPNSRARSPRRHRPGDHRGMGRHGIGWASRRSAQNTDAGRHCGPDHECGNTRQHAPIIMSRWLALPWHS